MDLILVENKWKVMDLYLLEWIHFLEHSRYDDTLIAINNIHAFMDKIKVVDISKCRPINHFINITINVMVFKEGHRN